MKVEELEDRKISVCDMMKSNTSEIIKKFESQIPTYAQIYSDMYQEYLHMFDDLFGTCYISEKEFFDKLNLDSDFLKTLDRNWKAISEVYFSQIEYSTNFLRAYAKMRISMMKSFEEFAHVQMDSYAKMLGEWNAKIENR